MSKLLAKKDLATTMFVSPCSRNIAIVLFASIVAGCTTVDAMRRVEVDFDYVSQQAEELAAKRYREPDPLPDVLRQLDYSEYQKIRYNNNSYIWKEEGLPFAAGFFHLGYLYKDRVEIHEFTPTHEQRIRYLSTFFEFDDEELASALPSSLDYAGFRISTTVPNQEHYWETASFLGASYFRGVGLGQRYGASARGVAINSGLSLEEEFPRFSRVWLGKPLGNAKELVVYALLEGPSLTGAYRFIIKPGNETVMDVKARFFMRESVESFGIAPVTSMYWRGENRTSAQSDYRPEVHDSDGIIIKENDTGPIWRPFDLSQNTRLSYFSVDSFDGYGIMQRDRDFESYQDMEADYHKRPSVWIDAKGDWGSGFIKLVELPTSSEFDDNIVAFWEPVALPQKGDRLDFEYSLHWSGAQVPQEYPDAHVVATRIGEDQSYPGTHVFVLDFVVKDGEQPGEGAQMAEAIEREPPEVRASVEGPSSLVDTHVAWNPHEEAWRVVLRVESPEESRTEAVELRCQLAFDDGSVSETWAYQWSR